MFCPPAQPRPGRTRLLVAVTVAVALCIVAAASTPAVHAQADDLVVRWSIEGQPPHRTESGSVGGGSDSGDVTVVVERHAEDGAGSGPVRDDPGASLLPGLEEFKYDAFVTGNQYSVGD